MRMFITSKNKYLSNDMKIFGTCSIPLINWIVLFKFDRVDFNIPEEETVGGYSMCSCPSILHKNQILDLAVKYSKHPPALWVHTQVRIYTPNIHRVQKDPLWRAGLSTPPPPKKKIQNHYLWKKCRS